MGGSGDRLAVCGEGTEQAVLPYRHAGASNKNLDLIRAIGRLRGRRIKHAGSLDCCWMLARWASMPADTSPCGGPAGCAWPDEWASAGSTWPGRAQ
jgi:hypothetical protein